MSSRQRPNLSGDGYSSPELGQGCSFSENGLNQNLSVVWLKFLKVVSDPKAMGTPDSA